MAESMVFYRSFYEALEGLSDETKASILDAILRYGLYNEEPKLKGVETSLFRLIRPQIDANTERRENGKKGGRPRKPKTIGFENENHRLLKSKPNENVNVNVNANVNENDNENVFSSSSCAYARGGEENPDDDYDLRHEDDGRTYFEPRVKLGWKKSSGVTSTGHEPLTQEQKEYWSNRAKEFAKAHGMR